jgi:hypothetical protein
MFHPLQNVLIILLSYFYRFFIIHEYTNFIWLLQIIFNKKKRKVINKKLGKAKKKSYIGRNIKINKEMAKIEITKEQFTAYVRVQKSGVTNMFDIRNVTALTGLDKNQCIAIMEQYSELDKKYN